MDARVYFTLQDAIDHAASVADLRTTRDLMAATTMHAMERGVLERRLQTREAELRGREVAVDARAVERAD